MKYLIETERIFGNEGVGAVFDGESLCLYWVILVTQGDHPSIDRADPPCVACPTPSFHLSLIAQPTRPRSSAGQAILYIPGSSPRPQGIFKVNENQAKGRPVVSRPGAPPPTLLEVKVSCLSARTSILSGRG